MTEDPVIFAMSGAIANRDQCPAIPYTPRRSTRPRRGGSWMRASMIHIRPARPTACRATRLTTSGRSAIRGEVDVIINYSTGAIGVPVEAGSPTCAAPAGRSGAQHELDELREVLAAAGSFVFKAVFENSFDTIVGTEAMNRLEIRPGPEVLRPAGASPISTRSSTWPVAAAAGAVRHGRERRHPAERAQPGNAGRPGAERPGRAEQLGGDRHQREQWMLVAAS